MKMSKLSIRVRFAHGEYVLKNFISRRKVSRKGYSLYENKYLDLPTKRKQEQNY